MEKNNFINHLLSNLLALYCFLLPFEEALASSFGSILKLFGVLIIFFCILFYRKSKFKLHKIHISLILWFFLITFSFYWSNSQIWWNYFFRIYLGQILFFVVITTLPIKGIILKKIRNGFIFGSILTVIIMIFSPTSMIFTDEGRRTIMLFSTSLDPNIISAILSICFFMLLEKVMEKIKIRRKYINEVIQILIIIVGVLYTGSRGGLVAIIVSFLMWLFLMRKILNFKFIIIFIFLSITIMFIGFSNLPETLLARYSINSLLGFNEINSNSHSRLKIWSYTYQLFLNKPILGYGNGNFFDAITTVYRETASHNLYILVLIEGGIFGFILFMYPIYLTLWNSFKSKEFTSTAMFITVLIIGIFLDGITFKFFWISWFYTYVKFIQSRIILDE